MLTSFINMLIGFNNRYIPLCCSKSNTSDAPPECIEADNLGIGVLSIEADATKDVEQDQSPD